MISGRHRERHLRESAPAGDFTSPKTPGVRRRGDQAPAAKGSDRHLGDDRSTIDEVFSEARRPVSRPYSASRVLGP
jgi:hypothetical protein